MKISEEDKILQNLMNTIILVAMEDGVITQDELAILKQVKFDIKKLRNAIQDAEKEAKNEEELILLKNFRKNLLQNAYDISKSDRIITQDERNLINTLIRSLMS